jgi:hypothetical protein
MMRGNLSSVLFVLGLSALALVNCDCGSDGPRACQSNEECGDYQYCDVDIGLCLCSDDRGCGSGEFCNPVSRCQAISGCLSNEDCQQSSNDFCENSFCDVNSGRCVSNCFCDPETDDSCCTLDSQCGFSNICLDGRCRPGCRTHNGNGDCRLGEGCVAEPGQALGLCAAGTCTANNLCNFGEICDLIDGACTFDTRGPYCFACSGGIASEDCGEPANYCLTDSTDPTGQSEFCGVDCSQGQPCPFGYGCNDVIIIPPSAPFCTVPEYCVLPEGGGTGACSENPGIACTEDEDCPEGPPGGTCPRAAEGNCLVDQTQSCSEDTDCCDDADACPEGSCVKQLCVGGEGDAFGYCTCTRDLDCPRDECRDADLTDPDNPIQGHCHLSGHRCYEDIDCDVIACVDGGCRIGANCAPANDRNCREVADQRNGEEE